MEELINLVVNNGIGVVCVAFMIYFINTTLKDNTEVLNKIQQTLVAIEVNLDTVTNRLNNLENKIKVRKIEEKEDE